MPVRHTWPDRIVLALILAAGIAGTMLTVEGCPLTWPLSPRHFGLPRPLSWSARPERGLTGTDVPRPFPLTAVFPLASRDVPNVSAARGV